MTVLFSPLFRMLKGRADKSIITNIAATSIASQPEQQGGWFTPQTADTLLDTPFRQELIALLWQRVSLSEPLFQTYYLSPIKRFAELIQLLPASESHHHAYLGGLLEHTLEMINFAVKLRQPYLLPVGASSEEQTTQSEAWTAAIIYAALLHDIGKVAVDIEVERQSGERWHPWQGQLTEPYRFRYNPNRQYRLHNILGSLFCTQIIPPQALSWLSQFPELYSSFLNCIAGHNEHAGVIGELIQQADQLSVAQNLGGDTSKITNKPQTTLAKQLILALRYIVKNEFVLNNTETGSDGWLTADGLWLVSKKIADRIRAYLLQNGITGVPQSNSQLFSELQTYNLVIANGEKAIWKCDIRSNKNWSSQLTVLKINPALIWENADTKPNLFEGEVTPHMETTGTVPNMTTDSHIQFGQTEEGQMQVAETGCNSSLMSTNESKNTVLNPLETGVVSHANSVLNEFTLNLFAGENTDLEVEHNKQFIEVKAVAEVTLDEQEAQSLAALENGKPAQNEHPFIAWIRCGLLARKIDINSAKAKVHIVDNTVFLVSPNIFKQYMQETTGSVTNEDWKTLQKAFQQLELHKRRQPDNQNFWECEIVGAAFRKKDKKRVIKGYLLKSGESIFNNGQLPPNNPFLTLRKDYQESQQ